MAWLELISSGHQLISGGREFIGETKKGIAISGKDQIRVVPVN
jgi:hypothetical protein